jgi:Ca2+-binding EF-hand superfamily protein
MSLARQFEQNGRITSSTAGQDVPSREENMPKILQEFDKDVRGAIFEGNLLPIRDSLTDRQRDTSVIREAFDGDLKRILSELEKVTEKV